MLTQWSQESKDGAETQGGNSAVLDTMGYFGNVKCVLLTTWEGLSGPTVIQASLCKLKLAISTQFMRRLQEVLEKQVRVA